MIQLGVFEIAYDEGYSLKITDYGKYLYQANKKAHEQRKSSRGSQLKEVKFRPATAERANRPSPALWRRSFRLEHYAVC